MLWAVVFLLDDGKILEKPSPLSGEVRSDHCSFVCLLSGVKLSLLRQELHVAMTHSPAGMCMDFYPLLLGGKTATLDIRNLAALQTYL